MRWERAESQVRYGRSIRFRLRPRAAGFIWLLPVLAGCTCDRHETLRNYPERKRPILSKNVAKVDRVFRSDALVRCMPYRVLMPASVPRGDRLPVVYMLHGDSSYGFQAWSVEADVSQFAEKGLILVMPEGDTAYYTNAAQRSGERYEDYIVKDLISDVESRFPVATRRTGRAIIGYSLGGFGAVKIALRYPELFAFAAGLSPSIDIAARRPDAEKYHEYVFGPWGSTTRLSNDPFHLVTSVEPDRVPYLFLSCGQREGLVYANRRFASMLGARHIAYEFHEVSDGYHGWLQWRQVLREVFSSLFEHLKDH